MTHLTHGEHRDGAYAAAGVSIEAGDKAVELPDESLLGKHLLEVSLQTPTMGEALPVLNNP